MSHSCILVQPTPAYLFHFQDGKHFNSTTNQATLQILNCPRQSPTENVHVLHPQTKEKLKAASYAAGKVSVVDPLLKLGDAQQSAGRAWRALHWAAGRGLDRWASKSFSFLGVEGVLGFRFEMVQMPDIWCII